MSARAAMAPANAASAMRPISSAVIVTPVQYAILSSGRREAMSPKIMAATPTTYIPISSMVTMMPARRTHWVTVKSFRESSTASPFPGYFLGYIDNRYINYRWSSMLLLTIDNGRQHSVGVYAGTAEARDCPAWLRALMPL